MSSVMQNTAKKEGMIIAYWSVDTEDWKSRNPAQIISRAEHGAYDGSIILMHDIYGLHRRRGRENCTGAGEKGLSNCDGV